MDKKYTINFEPLPEGGQLVTVPEIGVSTVTPGTTLAEAQSAGLAAITAHLEQQKKRTRRQVSRRAKAS
jgi:predicted RNase H-like HicB family nuclease